MQLQMLLQAAVPGHKLSQSDAQHWIDLGVMRGTQRADVNDRVGGLQAEYSVRVQLLEIYNEQLRDLLDTSRSGKRLDIRNTERSGLNVPDAIQVCRRHRHITPHANPPNTPLKPQISKYSERHMVYMTSPVEVGGSPSTCYLLHGHVHLAKRSCDWSFYV